MPVPKPYPRADGTVTYRVRFRVDGTETSETFATLAQANTFCSLIDALGAQAARAQRESLDRASSAYVPTVEEQLHKYVAEMTGVDQRTRDDYLGHVSAHWRSTIGRYRLDTVTRATVAHVVNSLDGKVAPKTIKNTHSLLSAVMQSAVHDQKIEVNPCKGTRLPRAGEEDVEEIRFLGHGEFDRLLDGLPDHRQLVGIPAHWQAFVILLFGTGLRFSEATALQVQDVNLNDVQGATLRVVRAWKKGGRIGPPKSRASRRTIALPDVVVDVIRPLIAGRAGSAWLFTTETGLVIRHANFFNRVWKPATVRASICAEHLDPACRCIMTKHAKCPVHVERDEKGHHVLVEPCGCPGTVSPRPRIHDARHTHASWLIANGVRLEVIQDRLGHEDYTTTRRVYGHLMPDMRRDAGIAAQLAFESTRLARGLPSPL